MLGQMGFEMEISKLLKELEKMQSMADTRSRDIIVNGREIPETDRARSEGYSSAYSFCILRLKQILLENQ